MESVSAEFHTEVRPGDLGDLIEGQANPDTGASKGHAKPWAAPDGRGRVPNIWIDDTRITPDALAILQFMALHPGWTLRRGHMTRPRAKGGASWSKERYIEARTLLIGLGLIDPNTRKLIPPANTAKAWTLAFRGEARDAIYSGPRGIKATVVALYSRRFKKPPSRAEIAKRFDISEDTVKRAARGAKSNNPQVQNGTGGGVQNRTGVGVQNRTPPPVQNRTPTQDEDYTQDEDRLMTIGSNNQHQHSVSRRADADRDGPTEDASQAIATPETLDMIGDGWSELADVIPSDGSAEEPAIQAAVMAAIGTHDPREYRAIVDRLRSVRWERVRRNPAGYARRVIENEIGSRIVIRSEVVSAMIKAYDAHRNTPDMIAAETSRIEQITSPDALAYFQALVDGIARTRVPCPDALRAAAYPVVANLNQAARAAVLRSVTVTDWSGLEYPEAMALAIVMDAGADHDPAAAEFAPIDRHVSAVVEAWREMPETFTRNP